MNLWQRSSSILRWIIAVVLVLSLVSCTEKGISQEVTTSFQETQPKAAPAPRQFSEVSPPEVIQQLRPALEGYQPQVAILTPQADEVLSDNTVSVRFQVKDLPIFKDSQWQLGPNLHVILDNQPYIAVYDLNQPLVLSDLTPGTHTLRVFASRPWHESFKNEGAYAQTTFHVLTKTDDNNPDPSLPLLTYSRPQDNYGAEPILLDFYLTNAPLHLVAKDNPDDNFSDWRIRCTINGESFILDSWQPIYLQGFKPGKNWVKLEFLDNQGNPLRNVFNTTIRLITYRPNGQDTLSRIVRGDLKADEVRGIVDQSYVQVPVEETVTAPEVKQPETTPSPQPVTPVPAEVKLPETTPSPQPVTPVPAEVKLPETTPSPQPVTPIPAEVKLLETTPSPQPVTRN